MTDLEHAVLLCTLLVQDTKRFQCDWCQSRYADPGMIARNKKIMACTKEMGGVSYSVCDWLSVTLCPGGFYSYEATKIVDLYYAYKAGILPYSGGVLDQPNKIMECFRVIDGYVSDKMERERKQDRRKVIQLRHGRK